MLYLLTSFTITFILCLVFIKMNYASSVDVSQGVQNFHDWKVPRIGGFVIFPSLVFVSITFLQKKTFAN